MISSSKKVVTLGFLFASCLFNYGDALAASETFYPTVDRLNKKTLARDLLSRDFQLKFSSGKFSTVVSNAVVRGDRDRHYFKARPGQYLTIAIASLENNAVFNLYYRQNNQWYRFSQESRTWSGNLPFSSQNQYLIEVGGTRGNATYDLFVAIAATN